MRRAPICRRSWLAARLDEADTQTERFDAYSDAFQAALLAASPEIRDSSYSAVIAVMARITHQVEQTTNRRTA